MKKKLSRLLCALLVMTMVLAMVPAVSAADTLDKSSASDPYIMYQGDAVAFGCQLSGHTCTAKYENEVRGATSYNYTSATYVSYNSSTKKIDARTATAYTQSYNSTPEFGYVKVTLTCDKCTDTDKTKTAYFRVYSKATGITLKNASGTTLTSLSMPVSNNQKIYYTLTPTTMNPDNIAVSFRNSEIEVVDFGSDATGTYFTVNVKKGGIVTKMDVTLDGDTSHTPVTKSYDVVTGSAANLTLKTGNTILAESNDDGDSY